MYSVRNELTIHWCTYKGYGGFITNSVIPNELLRQFTNFFIKNYPVVRLRNNPIAPSYAKYLPWSNLDATQIINLREVNKECSLDWSRGHQRSLKKAKRLGIKINIAEAKDWETFYNIYMDTVKRWEKPKTIYSRRFFNILQKHLKKVTLWVAYYKTTMIAGVVCFYHNKHIHVWLSGMLTEYKSYCPSHLLQFKIIVHAKANGFWWYDLGLSGKYEGIKYWKSGFNPITCEANVYKSTPEIFQLISHNAL